MFNYINCNGTNVPCCVIKQKNIENSNSYLCSV